MSYKFIAGAKGKGGGGGSRTPSTDPDSLNSKSFGQIVDLISEGEIGGLVDGVKSIFFDNSPLQNADGSFNFTDLIVEAHNGTATQPVLPSFQRAANVIPNSNPSQITSSGQVFTISDPSVDQVQFLISVPTLQKIKNNGDTLGTSFTFKIQRSLGQGAFQDVLGNTTITGRTGDLYQKQYAFDTSALSVNDFPVAYKVIRVGTAGDTNLADDTAYLNANSSFISHVSKFYVSSVTLIKHQNDDISGTYTHSGTTVTILSSSPHLLSVGDSIGCNFIGNTDKNRNLEVATVAAENELTVEHPVSVSPAQTGSITIGQRFNYPNSAVIGLRINAEEFNSVPRRAYLIKGIKVKIPTGVTVDPNNGRIIYPANYIFNGVLGAAQWTTDPAWCLFDLLTSERYGCGDFIKANQLDVYSFYAASVYSSELVTFKDRSSTGVVTTITEPRFSLNVNIQTRQDVFKVVNSLCSVFRAMPLYVSGSLSLIQDKAGINPSFLFSEANVTQEGFSYSGSSAKTRATVIVVKYFDLELRDAAYEQIIDNDAMLKYGAITKNINSFGVTSRHQARRLGKWFLTTLATETDIVSFSTTIQSGALITPGQIIEIQDPVKSGVRRGGQITAVTNNGNDSIITVDSLVDMPDLSGQLTGFLTVILPDGQISRRTIISITNDKKITCSGRFQKLINDSSGNKPFLDNTRQKNPVYTDTFQVTDPNVGSFWILETTGSTASIRSQLYKVIAVEENDDFTYAVTAVLHNSSKYAAVEALETLEHRDVTNLDLVPNSPSQWATDVEGVTYPIEQLYKYRSQIKVRVLLAWKPVVGVNRYEVRYQQDNSGYQIVEIQDPSYSINDINVASGTASLFDFQVRSISASGKKSNAPLTKTSFSVIGKNAKPSQVSSDFAGSLDPNLGIVLSWTPIVATYPNFADLDIRGYKIYEGTYGTGTFLGEHKATSLLVPTLPSSTDPSKRYEIKAVDEDGNESQNVRHTIVGFDNPNVPTSVVGTYSNDNYIITWTAPALTGNRFAIKEYEIRQNNNLIATTDGLSFTLPVTWNGSQTFTIRAKDITDRVSTDATLTATFTKAAAPNIEYKYEGAKIRLSWVKPAEGNMKIKDYIIKASSTSNTDFSTATDVDVINSESYLLEVDHSVLNTSTARRFFVAARDANENLGNIGRTGISNYPDVSVTPSPQPTNLNAVVKGASAFVSWDEVPVATLNGKVNGLPIAFYKIYREAANATTVSTADFQQNGTSITEEVTWTDATQRYFVRAIDVNGNEGLLQNVDFTVTPPSAVTNLTNEVIDNNVLLRWTESSIGTGQLPIKHYNIYKNSTASGNLVGQKLGTFTTVFEQVGGSFEYILKPVNTAGTEGGQLSTNAEVNEPPDFVLTNDFQSALTGAGITTTNSFFDGGGLFFCIDASRTWKQHFDPNNNDTSRTFGVYGGSSVYALPSENTGDFEEIVDTGATIASTRIEGTLGLVNSETVGEGYDITYKLFTAPDIKGTYVQSGTTVTIDITGHGLSQGDQVTTEYSSDANPPGSPVNGTFSVASVINANRFTVTASNSATDNGKVSIGSGTYTEKGTGTGQRINVLGQDFRFIKVQYEFTGTNNNDLIKVNSSRIKLFLKRKTDQGRVVILGSSNGGSNGVVVTMTETFIDVDAIQLSIQGQSSAKYVIYDFKDEPNPNLTTGFRIFVYTTNGSFPTDDTVVDFTIRGV